MEKKTKNAKLQQNGQVGLNRQDLKEFVISETQFITELLDRLPIPTTSEGYGGDDDYLTTSNGEVHKKPPVIDGHRANRAQTLEELASKLQVMHGKRLPYKNKIEKKSLKNKLKKLKKSDERQLKKKLLRVQKSDEKKPVVPENEKSPPKPLKPVFNSDGKLVFSKFDFSDIGNKFDEKKEQRDPKKIMKQMKKQKEKIELLESKGETEKVKELKEKETWKLALKKSQGVKVKDDPELLKKSIKRIDQRKKQSSKKWKTREKGVKRMLEEKQKKRTQNIQQRKDQNKQKKAKRGAKKGRITPGF